MKLRLCIVLLGLLFLSGCFALPVEDPLMAPPIMQMPEVGAPRTVPVMRGTVTRSSNPFASYVPAREEFLRFDVDGFRILGIYVDIGDYVQEGDIIASLDRPDITAQINNLTRQLEWQELSISQAQRRRRAGHDVTQADINLLRRQLEIIQMELDYLERVNNLRYLRAGMDGMVSQVVLFTPGMESNSNIVVATIIDQGYSIFATNPIEAGPYMDIGDHFTMYLNGEPYRVVVIDPEEYDIQRDRRGEIYLAFVDENPIIPPNPRANVYVIMYSVEDALHVHWRAVHSASDRTFVFVLREDGIREIRDVEVGLRGNGHYEILVGLTEGELVIIE